jgi:hypothetical protein
VKLSLRHFFIKQFSFALFVLISKKIYFHYLSHICAFLLHFSVLFELFLELTEKFLFVFGFGKFSIWNLHSDDNLSFLGQPDKLRWCVYKPVIWPDPLQPGVGHLLVGPAEKNGKFIIKFKADTLKEKFLCNSRDLKR